MSDIRLNLSIKEENNILFKRSYENYWIQHLLSEIKTKNYIRLFPENLIDRIYPIIFG